MITKITGLILLIFCSINVYSQGVWIDLTVNPAPPQLNSVSTISHDICWAGGDGGTVIQTTNGGALWTNHGGGALGTGNVFVISAIDQNTALVGVNNGSSAIIYRTSNAGQVWNITPPFPQQGGFIDDIKMVNSTTGFAYGDPVGGRWSIFKTTNGGVSWDSSGLRVPEINGEVGWWNAMAVYQANVGGPISVWFGTDQKRVYKTSNSGVNWSSATIPAGLGNNIFSISFLNAQTGFCGSDNAVCFSNNGGLGWVIEPAAPTSGSVNAICNNSGYLWYTTNKFIYYSTDGGTSFVQQHISPGVTEYSHMSFANTLTENVESIVGGYAITGKSVISKYTHANIGVQQIGTEIPSQYSLSQNYPNPFNPETKIRFSITNTSGGRLMQTKLIVYDMLGNEVTTLINEQLKPGVYETSWDASGYSSGIYVYRLVVGGDAGNGSNGNYTETRKMILLK